MKGRLSEAEELAGFKVLAIEFGEPAPHREISIALLVVIVIGGVLLVVGGMMCWRFKCWRKLKDRLVRREISYEMYGEFRDESSAK